MEEMQHSVVGVLVRAYLPKAADDKPPLTTHRRA